MNGLCRGGRGGSEKSLAGLSFKNFRHKPTSEPDFKKIESSEIEHNTKIYIIISSMDIINVIILFHHYCYYHYLYFAIIIFFWLKSYFLISYYYLYYDF